MPRTGKDTEAAPEGAREFRTTHWSVVLAAGREDTATALPALETLCQAYWHPLYAFVRRQGHGPEEARDLTQEFFARLLEQRPFGDLDPGAGRFRSWLLKVLKNFLVKEWRKEQAQKRGGGEQLIALDDENAGAWLEAELADAATPESAYERCWAGALMERVMERLAGEYEGSAAPFAELQAFLVEPRGGIPYNEVAVRHGTTEGALKSLVFRMRRRYREIFREEVAHTVGKPAEVEDEMRHILEVLSR